MYADDTAILTQSASLSSAIQQLQEHIHAIESWLIKWKIELNIEKTEAIVFSKKIYIYGCLTIFDKRIPWVKHTKYLGVILDRRLTFVPHINHVIKKFRVSKQTLAPLIARNSCLDIDHKLLIYTAALRPILTYACPVLGYLSKTNLRRLQSVENITLRIITGTKWYIRNTAIYKELNIKCLIDTMKIIAENFYANLHASQNPSIPSMHYDINAPSNRKRPKAILRNVP
ncbi:RNA-directed DNA polymerase from mobile element jockey, partial [Stegodyphus mimosarum]